MFKAKLKIQPERRDPTTVTKLVALTELTDKGARNTTLVKELHKNFTKIKSLAKPRSQ